MPDYSDAVMQQIAEQAMDHWQVVASELELVSRSENVVFRVKTQGQGDFALRIHRPGYHTMDELNSELVWCQALRDGGIGVPLAQMTKAGGGYAEITVPNTAETRQVGLVQWFQGDRLEDKLLGDSDREARAPLFAQLGGLMARMHNQSASWKPPATFTRHAFDADGLMGDAPFWGPFWELAELSESQRQLVLRARTHLHSRLEALGKGPGIYSMIHADLHAGNVLVDDGKLQVIDMDDAGFGFHAYDLAVALFFESFKPEYAEHRDAMVVGYRAERGLSDEMVALLPMFLVCRGLAVLGWLHERPELGRDVAPMAKAVCDNAEAYLASGS